MNACNTGPMPEISHDVDPSEEDVPDTTPESLSIEEGDHIFATGLFPPGLLMSRPYFRPWILHFS